jgi:hypothetical protein
MKLTYASPAQSEAACPPGQRLPYRGESDPAMACVIRCNAGDLRIRWLRFVLRLRRPASRDCEDQREYCAAELHAVRGSTPLSLLTVVMSPVNVSP